METTTSGVIRMSQPKALILGGIGINCNIETGFAFEQAGAEIEQVNIDQLDKGLKKIEDYQIFVVPGGFSKGDNIAAGRWLGLKFRALYADDLNKFVEDQKAIVGICNGLQVLVESGLLPSGEVIPPETETYVEERRLRNKVMSMVSNEQFSYDCRWGRLTVDESTSRFIGKELVGEVIELPSAHQEGKVATLSPIDTDRLDHSGQVVFRYVDKNNQPTRSHPENPNGSYRGMTGFCDETGVVLGLMPHLERANVKYHHPNWRRGDGNNPFGAKVIKNIVNYAKEI